MFLNKIFDFSEIILENFQQKYLNNLLRKINNFLDQKQKDRFQKTVFWFFLFFFKLFKNIGNSYCIYIYIFVAVSSLNLRLYWFSGQQFLYYRIATQLQQ